MDDRPWMLVLYQIPEGEKVLGRFNSRKRRVYVDSKATDGGGMTA